MKNETTQQMKKEPSNHRGPHLLSGMAPKPWFQLLFGGGVISLRRLPDVIEITLRSSQFRPLTLRERSFRGAEVAAHTPNTRPIFIIGHYRSGTTYLHNLMARDPQFAFPTLFDVAFPHAFLSAEDILKPIIEKALPETRCSDNLALSVNAPQEDEFAIGKLSPYCFYHGLYFPKKMKCLFDRGVLLNGSADRTAWADLYRAFLTKVSLKGEGRVLLLKNPAHSARIDLLLEMYPQARFIHIHRHPIEVYRSTRHLFATYIRTYGFQSVSERAVDEMVRYTYENLMPRLFEGTAHIPKGQFVEVCFDDLKNDALSVLKSIYDTLKLDTCDDLFARFAKYVDEQKTFQANTYSPNTMEEEIIRQRWQFAFERLGYT